MSCNIGYMGIQNYIEIEPVRSLSALLTFGAAVIVGLAYNQHWAGDAVALISGGWAAFIAFIGTFFTRGAVTPNSAVEQKVHDTIVELAPMAPQLPVDPNLP